MNKVLVINASARKERSLSRFMTNVFVETWLESSPNDKIIYREVGQDNIPHVSEAWIAAAFRPAYQRTEENKTALKISDQLISELKQADIIVLGTPMYNWSIPSALKAYFDQVLRVNETVSLNKDTPENLYNGLLENKKVFILMVRGNGGYSRGDFNEHMDFQTKYIHTVFNIMGLNVTEEVIVEGVDLGGNPIEEAARKVRELFVFN
ncbi:FMN-dependent NADH-azoreductase [Sphingobacterium siyangense]|uniref:FMN-dependent NADH-azoreductase n=1 Tax=Sphingobacterium siyangense TaxID=459529 RepID=UPI003DA45806